ncbi:MAG: glycosyltransferase family 87 protein [Terracidiphilus sp.]|jgi:hypothetical protein
MKKSPWRILAALVMMAAAIGVLILIVNNNNAGQRDFVSYWAAGQQLAHGANPYDGPAIHAVEQAAGYNLDHPLMMRNPPEALFLTLPLGFVSPNTGLILWMLALLASLVASIRMLWQMHGRPQNSLHLLGYCFAPIMECMMAGQIGIFLLLGVVLFLYFRSSQPFLAGSALLLCAAKPHLFLPFGIVLLLWIVFEKQYRILAGFCVAVFASLTLAFCIDMHAWSQYSQMMRTGGALDERVPVLSVYFRLLVDRNAEWVQFVPLSAACVWALWYYWTRRSHWSWTDQGLLLLLVSALCRPFGWFTDEAILLPAVLAGIYRADERGRSLLPFGFIAGVAMFGVCANILITSPYYLWTTPAWLAWYLYANRPKNLRETKALGEQPQF